MPPSWHTHVAKHTRCGTNSENVQAYNSNSINIWWLFPFLFISKYSSWTTLGALTAPIDEKVRLGTQLILNFDGVRRYPNMLKDNS